MIRSRPVHIDLREPGNLSAKFTALEAEPANYCRVALHVTLECKLRTRTKAYCNTRFIDSAEPMRGRTVEC